MACRYLYFVRRNRPYNMDMDIFIILSKKLTTNITYLYSIVQSAGTAPTRLYLCIMIEVLRLFST